VAVENKYFNSDLEAGDIPNSAKCSGVETFKLIETYEVVAGATNASIYKFAKSLSGNCIITDIKLSHDAFGSSGALDVGVWPSDSYTAKDDDVFAAAVDISSAGREVDGMANLAIENLGKKLYLHAGDTVDAGEYDLGVILDNVGATGAGTLTIEVEYIQGN